MQVETSNSQNKFCEYEKGCENGQLVELRHFEQKLSIFVHFLKYTIQIIWYRSPHIRVSCNTEDAMRRSY